MLIALCVYRLYQEKQIQEEKGIIHEVQRKMQEEVEPTKVQEILQKTTQKENDIQVQQVLQKYRQLYKENNDMYGRIKIEGTNIDYPVMFTPEEPNFYSDKNWEKEQCYRKVGTSIWIDGRTTEESENIIIYGHNSETYVMFRTLMDYKDPQYYEEHKYITFDTLYEEGTYEIISVAKAVVYYEKEPPEGEYLYYEHIELNSKEEFDAYIQNAKENAYYDIEVTAEYGDKLITLSTCDYWTQNARLIIVAKKID